MASGGHAKTMRSSGKRYQKDEDFQEGEVWGLMEDLGGSGSLPKVRSHNPKLISSSSKNLGCSTLSPRMMIPRKEIISSKEYIKRSSAPLTIPTSATNRQMMFHGNGPSSWVDDGHDDGDGDDDDEDEIVPPHEYIAKRLARTQISSFCVCEGVGRKLKGRDLSEVRNDVLRKTGFLES